VETLHSTHILLGTTTSLSSTYPDQAQISNEVFYIS